MVQRVDGANLAHPVKLHHTILERRNAGISDLAILPQAFHSQGLDPLTSEPFPVQGAFSAGVQQDRPVSVVEAGGGRRAVQGKRIDVPHRAGRCVLEALSANARHWLAIGHEPCLEKPRGQDAEAERGQQYSFAFSFARVGRVAEVYEGIRPIRESRPLDCRVLGKDHMIDELLAEDLFVEMAGRVVRFEKATLSFRFPPPIALGAFLIRCPEQRYRAVEQVDARWKPSV